MEHLGVPVAAYKTECPTRMITIEVDLRAGILCLPTDKFPCLTGIIKEWSSKCYCTNWELLMLIGQLQHALLRGQWQPEEWKTETLDR